MKKIVSIFFVLVFVLCLSACHVEDTNGDDNYDLETYTDEDIIEGTNITTTFSYQSYVNNKGKFGCSKMSGVKLIDTFHCNNGTLRIEFTSNVTKGNFKLVVVHDGIIDVIPINQTYVYEVNNALGDYEIKVVGESAKFEMTYEWEK